MTVIGIDATALSNRAPGGIGTSQYAVMREMAAMDLPHRFILYATKPLVIPFTDRPLDLDWPVRIGTGPSSRSNILWMQAGVNPLLREDAVGAFWGPRHLLPFRARDIATVATIHDFWDRVHPGQQPLLYRTANTILIDLLIRRADVLVTPSQSTADDIERYAGAGHGPVRVVPPGVDMGVFSARSARATDGTLERVGASRPYVLAMDVFNPRKNVAAVMDALGRLAHEGRRVDLVALGRPRRTAVEVDVDGLARRHGISERVRVAGDVSSDELVALYSGALAFVYPSVYEGFGSPVVEAMASGCPVVTSNTSSLPEVAGNAAVLVEPQDAGAIAASIARLMDDPSEHGRLATAGLARARGFTWRRSADGIVAALEEALDLHRGDPPRR